MTRIRSLLTLIGYGFAATLAIFYGLVERHSLFSTFVVFHVVVCLGIPLVHGWWEGSLVDNWRRAWGRFEKRGALFGTALGVLLFTGILSGIGLILDKEERSDEIRRVLALWDLDGRWIWWFSFYLVIVNSLLEELFWRGFVLQRLSHVLSRSVAILLSSFFFSLYHLIVATILFGVKWGALMTLLVFGIGIIWGWMKGMFPSVYPTWFSHMLADLGIVTAALLWIY